MGNLIRLPIAAERLAQAERAAEAERKAMDERLRRLETALALERSNRSAAEARTRSLEAILSDGVQSGRVPALVLALAKRLALAASEPLPCGCVPCRGQCRSPEALEMHLEGLAGLASEVLSVLAGVSVGS